MAARYSLEVSQSRLEGLVKRGLLCLRTAMEEWFLPSREELPAQRDGYVVSVTHFHEHGFRMPPRPFFRMLLHHY
jgi:hypothetical protein